MRNRIITPHYELQFFSFWSPALLHSKHTLLRIPTGVSLSRHPYFLPYYGSRREKVVSRFVMPRGDVFVHSRFRIAARERTG